jgi:hypothetical protein
LFRHLQGIIHLNTQISHCALQFGAAKKLDATCPRSKARWARLYLGCRLSITTALARTMIDAGTEVTMTRTDAISGELVQKPQAPGVRGGISLQTLFCDFFQMRDACHQVVQVVHRRLLISDIEYVYATFLYTATRV